MTITGQKSVTRKLKRAKGKAMAASSVGLMAGGYVIANAAKEIITRKKLIKTGQMKRSIHPEVESSTVVKIGTDITDPPYPFFLEYGTSRMPPYSFLRPALDENKDKARREIRKALKQVL